MKTLILILALAVTGIAASDEIQPVASENRRLRIENAVLRVSNLDLQMQALQKLSQEARKELNEQVIAAAAEQKINIDEFDFDYRSLMFRRKADPVK